MIHKGQETLRPQKQSEDWDMEGKRERNRQRNVKCEGNPKDKVFWQF